MTSPTLDNHHDPKTLKWRNPLGVSREQQGQLANTIEQLNRRRNQTVINPEIDTRIASYKMAFRMQTSVPEWMDVSNEPGNVLEMYGATPGDGSTLRIARSAAGRA